MLPDAADAAVQEATLVGPVAAVWQVVVAPPDEPGVQELAPAQPVSVVWQLMVNPLVGPDAVQEEAFTQPVSVVWQTTVSDGVQLDTLLHVTVPVWQSTAAELPVQA